MHSIVVILLQSSQFFKVGFVFILQSMLILRRVQCYVIIASSLAEYQCHCAYEFQHFYVFGSEVYELLDFLK